MSDDESIVEEEYLIYADLRDNADPNIFEHAESSFNSFALDSDQPLLIIGGQAFVGTYKDTVGTAVFLEEAPTDSEEQIDIGNEPSDPLFVNSPTNVLRYVAHTRKTLEMSRVLLIEKKPLVEDSKDQNEENELKQLLAANKVANESVVSDPNVDGNNVKLSDMLQYKHEEMDNLVESNVNVGNGKVTPLEDRSSLRMDERQVVEDIEQMKLNDNSNSSNM